MELRTCSDEWLAFLTVPLFLVTSVWTVAGVAQRTPIRRPLIIRVTWVGAG